MSVTNIAAAPVAEDQIAGIVGRVFDEIAKASRKPDLGAVHEVIREAGIRNARRALAEAPDRLAEAQNLYREAQAREALAKDAYSQALIEAEWELDGRFHTDGNKTYLRLDCPECGGSGWVVIGSPREHGEMERESCDHCDGLGTTRKQMTADERKAYKASEAAKTPAVVTASLNLREAEETTATARDAVGIADRRFSAAKYDLTAAVAELNALAVGLSAKGA